MKARTRSALPALALLLAAAAALFLVWKLVDERGATEARTGDAEARLFDFEPAAVKELTVVARGTSTRLVREGSGWRIPSLGEEADRAAAEGVAERLAHARRKAEVAPAARVDAALLAATGLAAPRIQVSALLEGGASVGLALGERSSFDGSLHVRAGRGPVLLAAGDLEYALDRATDDLRDRTVLPLAREQVAGLRAEAGGKTIWAVERREGSGGAAAWALTAPRRAPARTDKVEAALQALGWLRALRFAAPGPAAAAGAGLVPPRRVYLMFGQAGKELGWIEIGREANDSAFVRSSAGPRILEVDKGSLASLPAAPEELEEKPPPAPATAPAAPPDPAPHAAPPLGDVPPKG